MKSESRGLFLLAIVVLVGAVAWFMWHVLESPRTMVLFEDGPAHWIRADLPLQMSEQYEKTNQTIFTFRLNPQQARTGGRLHLRAFRRVFVDLDGKQLFDSGPDLEKWKTDYSVQIPPATTGEVHSLQCIVLNRNGPCLLQARCDELGLATDPRWLASAGEGRASPAVTAEQIWEPKVEANQQPTRNQMFWLLPWLSALFLTGFVLSFVRCADQRKRASQIRWLILLGWIVLGANNIFKVNLGCGYDTQAHYQFIYWILKYHALPSPDGSWQFFQSPLYYLLSAGLWMGLAKVGVASSVLPSLMRLIPLISGLLLTQYCYRAAKIVYPNRGDLQAFATTVGGLLPMNMYMAQTVSNEPLAAVWGSLLLLTILKFTRHFYLAHTARPLIATGLLFGIAVLTKISLILWVVPLMIVLAISLGMRRASRTEWVRAVLLPSGSALLMTSWLFVRNMRLIGQPFFLQTSVRNSIWWQDPGFRTPGNFWYFGHVFTRPTYNGMASVWDSIYSTLWGCGQPGEQSSWHFNWMWYGLWLSIFPALSIIAGIVRCLLKRGSFRQKLQLRLCAISVGCFIMSIVYVYTMLPIYSCAKASYMLSTAPCLGLLAAAGLSLLPKNHWVRATVTGLLFCWAVTSFVTFFATN